MRIFISFILLALVCYSAFAEPEMTVETLTDANGKTLIRYSTPGYAEVPGENPSLHDPMTDQEVIWVDEHVSAIAENMAITGNGIYTVAGWWLNVERTSKYETGGNGFPLWEWPLVPNFKMPVVASDNGNVIASTGDVVPLCVWLNGAGPTPSWQYTSPAGFNSSGCDVSDDGSLVACAYKSTSTNDGLLYVFNSSSGTPVIQLNFDAENGINGVALSENGDWAALSTYYHVYVFDLNTSSLFWDGPNYGQGMVAIDADAEYLAKGDFYGQLTLYERNATGYSQQWQSYFGGWVTAVAISADGSTVMGGNMLFSPYRGIARGFDISGAQLWEYDQYGDEVGKVALCDNGTVGVAACWGQLDGTYGDVFTAFDMATGNVIFRLLDDIDEPGSIFCCDISDDGSSAVCGGKAVHARTFGNGGQAYAIELSEPGPFEVIVNLTPDTLPIVIPPAGGDFGYSVSILNTEIMPVTFRAWTEALMPVGSTYGPIIDRTVTLGGGASLVRAMSQTVPGAAPAGDYSYIANIGTAGGTVWNSSDFPFSKSGLDANSTIGGWIAGGWGEAITNGSVPPEGYLLSQNYPNPFNPSTSIDFQLPSEEFIELSVFNVLGKQVTEIVAGYLPAGEHSVSFDASILPGGVYFYRLEAGKFMQMKKMVLIK